MSNHELIVALGERTYSVERPWNHLPPNFAFGRITDLALDTTGNVYVYQRFDSQVQDDIDPVSVFDPAGKLVTSWGKGRIVDAHGISVSYDNRVLLVDRDAHQILVFDKDGKPLLTLGERNTPNRPFNHPTDVAVAPNGDFYVSDGYGGSNVHWFDKTGSHRKTWGEPGSGPGQFTTPHGIWVTGDERVLVCDRENNRVQIFSLTGDYLSEWGDFFHPMDVYVDGEGLVYVTDQIPRVTMLSLSGQRLGRCRPVLNGGHGMWGDKAGNLYFAEMNPNRVTRLRLHS